MMQSFAMCPPCLLRG